MFAVLSRFMETFKYSPLGQTPDTNPTRVRIHTFRFFSSRRLAVIASATLLTLLLLMLLYTTSHHNGLGYQGWPFERNATQASDAVDWSRFAYTQYATDAPYLCNSVMLFEILHRLGSKADRLLMYPSDFKMSAAGTDDESKESFLLRRARDEYNVKLQPIQVVSKSSSDRECHVGYQDDI